MYKMIIVDDERSARELIVRCIEKTYCGFSIIGSFSDATTAMSFIHGHHVDLVITDIKMSKVSGLEFSKALHELNPRINIIIISGFGKFEYAQQAIEYGVKNFFLKPVKMGELISAIKEIGNQIKKENDKMNRDRFFHELERGAFGSKDDIIRKMKEYNIPVHEDHAMNENFTKNINNYKSSVIEKAKAFIHENYQRDITRDDVAEYVFLNSAYFSRYFKQEAGQSFYDYLLNIRITKAKKLLETNMKITDISMAVGYKDVRYFVKNFKKHTKMSPTEYRSQM